jgi:hypothetical protein
MGTAVNPTRYHEVGFIDTALSRRCTYIDRLHF